MRRPWKPRTVPGHRSTAPQSSGGARSEQSWKTSMVWMQSAELATDCGNRGAPWGIQQNEGFSKTQRSLGRHFLSSLHSFPSQILQFLLQTPWFPHIQTSVVSSLLFLVTGGKSLKTLISSALPLFTQSHEIALFSCTPAGKRKGPNYWEAKLPIGMGGLLHIQRIHSIANLTWRSIPNCCMTQSLNF